MTGLVEHSTPLSLLKFTYQEEGLSLQDYYERDARKDRPVICVVNGTPVLRKDWHIVPTEDDIVRFVTLPQGGGGGGGGAKVLRTVATLALALAAPALAGAIGGAMGLGTIGISVLSAGIVIGGTMLINAILPPPTVGGSEMKSSSASPTYSLTAQGNSARLLEVIPKTYGRHRIYPDFAATPFVNYASNEQYLHQLFSLGLGDYDVEEVYIGDTRLWSSTSGISPSFQDVEIEIIPPGQPVSLFPSTVVTSTEVGSQELLCIDADRRVNFSGNRMTMSDSEAKEKLDSITIGDSVQISGGGANNGTYTCSNKDPSGLWVEFTGASFTSASGVTKRIYCAPWIGPFTTTPPDRETNRIQMDIVYPNGLYEAEDDGDLISHFATVEWEYRPVNTAGVGIGAWIRLGEQITSRRTPTAQRLTRNFTVPRGRYQVRMRRTSTKRYDTRFASTVTWAGMKAFVPDDNSYPNVTTMAVTIRASNQLTDAASRDFSVLLTSRIPRWDGSAWAVGNSREIGWIAADILRNNVYGAGLPDSRIDLAKLRSLQTTWNSRTDRFDGVFDAKTSIWEALCKVLAVGRAKPVMIGSVISFVRDEQASIIRGVFTPANITPGSLEVNHVLFSEGTPDAVTNEFWDSRTWRKNEVTARAPGATAEFDPARIEMFGVTNRAHAWREAAYQSAVNAYRRIFANFMTEMEGRLLSIGDTIMLSHDVADWGFSALILDYYAPGRRITFSEPIPEGVTRIAIADRQGRMWGPATIFNAANFDDQAFFTEATLAALGPPPIYIGSDEEPTRAILGTATELARRFKVVSTRPNGDLMQIQAVIDDLRVYAADTGTPPEENTTGWNTNTIPAGPPVDGVIVSRIGSVNDPITLNVSWNAAYGAGAYRVEWSQDGLDWVNVFQGDATSTRIQVEPGISYIRVGARRSLWGPWAYPSPNPATYGIVRLPPGTVSGLTAAIDPSAAVATASWNAGVRATSYRSRIYTESAPDVFDVLKLERVQTATSVLFTDTDILSAGGPWTRFEFGVVSINTAGESTEVRRRVWGVALTPPAGLSIITEYVGSELALNWNYVAAASSYRVELWEDSVLRATLHTTTNNITIAASSILSAGGPWRDFLVRVYAQNATMISAPSELTVTDVPPPAPTNVAITPTVGGAVVTWTREPTAVRTSFHGSAVTPFEPTVENRLWQGNLQSYTLEGLPSGVPYYIQIQSIDSYAGLDGYNGTGILEVLPL